MRKITRNPILSILLVGFITLAFSCNRQSSQQSSSSSDQSIELQQAITEIENKNYDLAIHKLKLLYSRYPTEEISLHLASAYAAKSGIRAAEIWGLSVGYKNPSEIKDSSSLQQLKNVFDLIQNNIEQFESPKSLSAKDKNEIMTRKNELLIKTKKLIKDGLLELRKVDVQFQKTPDIKGAQRKNLEIAISILRKHPSKRTMIYSAALFSIILKNALVETGRTFNFWREDSFQICDPNAKLFVQWVRYSLLIAVEFAQDFKVAYPKYQKALGDFQANTSSLIQQFDILLSNANTSDNNIQFNNFESTFFGYCQ